MTNHAMLDTYIQDARWNVKSARKVVERIVVTADLVVRTPLHLGTGDDNEMGSITLLMDENDKPLLTGTTLAGALRSYLLWREFGKDATNPENFDKNKNLDFVKAVESSKTVALLGGRKGDDDGLQSNLIIDDASAKNAEIEIRDGVRIDAQSRTAQDNGLYSFALWQAGTTFSIKFELLIYEDSDRQQLLSALATALHALEMGEISLGVRKHRGFGRMKVDTWNVQQFDLTTTDGLLAWVKGKSNDHETGVNIQELLNVDLMEDRRHIFNLSAQFVLDGSMLIRSDGALLTAEEITKDDNTGDDNTDDDDVSPPNTFHLHSMRVKDGDTKPVPILSGTAVAGAIRARALRIANTLHGRAIGQDGINYLFGTMIEEDNQDPTSSRVITHDAELNIGNENENFKYIQNRVSIDRFTGGAKDGALFSQQPMFSDNDVKVTLKIQLLEPDDAEIGLLLMLLKDLWTSDLPLGGESSVGRGRLAGQWADLSLSGKKWRIAQTGERDLDITGDVNKLESFAKAFYTGATS